MKSPATLLPPDEAERLLTLRHYDFLSTPPDDVFVGLVALAARVFGQPHAFIGLVEENEVIFPVAHSTGHLPPVPRAQALCSSAILYPHAVAYENLACAAQTGADAPAIRAVVTQGNRFYAAAPLRMPDGHHIGVLCLVGPAPRPFAMPEEEVLEAFAEVTGLALALRHLCRATPELGTTEWDAICLRLRLDLKTLNSRFQKLTQEHGAAVPVPAAVLSMLQEGLQSLRVKLLE